MVAGGLALVALTAASQLWGAVPAGASPSMQSTGSSFASVAIQQWVGQSATLYGLNINWQVSSSVVGLNNFGQSQIDFAASDIPYSAQQSTYYPNQPYQYMPDVAGGLAFMFNLNGVNGQQITDLNLNPSLIGQIFLGEITKWNDPQIVQANPQLGPDLPPSNIIPVYRSDASGENYLLTDYLLHQDNADIDTAQHAFQSGNPGQPTATWPTPSANAHYDINKYKGWNLGYPVGESGSDNAANYVSALSSQGSITYVETAFAKEHHFPVASLLNISGATVQPTSLNVATALEAAQLHTDLTQDLTNVYVNNQPNAYPLSAYSYIVSPCSPGLAAGQQKSCAGGPGATSPFAPAKGAALGQFVNFLACQGQEKMAELGYSPLPPVLVSADFAAIGRLNGGVEPPPPTASNCKNPYVDGEIPLPGSPVVAGYAGGGINTTTSTGAAGHTATSGTSGGGSSGSGSYGSSGTASGTGSGSSGSSGGIAAADRAAGLDPPAGRRGLQGGQRPVGQAAVHHPDVPVPPRRRAGVGDRRGGRPELAHVRRVGPRGPRRHPPAPADRHPPQPEAGARRRGRAAAGARGVRGPMERDRPMTTADDTNDHEGAMSAHPARSKRPARRFTGRGHRGLRIGLVLILAVATVAVVGVAVPLSSHSSTAGATTACSSDGNGGCQVVLPCPAGQTTNCPTIDVAPNTDVSDGQYVFVTATGFTSTTSIRVALCTAAVDSPDPQCLSGNYGSQYYQSTVVPVTADAGNNNLTATSYPVFEDASGEGNNKIPSYDLLNTGKGPGFYCDNTADPCEVVVTDEPGQGNNVGHGVPITTANSAVVPLVFAAQASGCPSTDAQVSVDASFSVEHFIPSAVEATCGSANGVVALSTSTDNATVISDYATGNASVSFVDNVDDPNQLAQLLGKPYAFIPIALSGTTESFLAGATDGGLPFPLSSLKLTPNMVAGLATSLYQSPEGSYTQPPKPVYTLSDNLMSALQAAGVTCAMLQGCPSTKPVKKQFVYEQRYDAFDLLNPVSTGEVSPQTYGSFNSNVSSGSSYEATNWVCSAPNTPFTVGVDEVGHTSPVDVTVTDPNVGSTTLVTPPLGSSIWPPYPGAQWVYPQCHGYSQLPALSATANNYGPAQSPAFQAKAMRSWCYGGLVIPQPGPTCAAFGLMDTSEAAFNGLSTASLENASGNFVAPTISSLQAAAAQLKACPAADLSCPFGTYTLDSSAVTGNAYPLANVTYAVVPTATLPYAQATAIKHLLQNLVTFSHSAAVPAGYAPLPTSLYTAALADITQDISSGPAPTTPTTTPTTSPSGTTQSPSGTSGSSGGSSGDNGSYSTGGPASELPLTASDSTGSGSGSGGSGSTPVVAPTSTAATGGFLLVVLSDTTRYLLPAIVVLALGSLAGGLFLLFGPGAARRRRRDDPGGLA